MPRFVLVTLAAAASLMGALTIAPTHAFACCADFDLHDPVGWSPSGELLVNAYEATDCVGVSTAEVYSPTEVQDAQDTRGMWPYARFDLYAEGRRLAPGRAGRSLSADDVWLLEEEAEDRGETGEIFPIPLGLRRRFSTPVRTLCTEDVFVYGVPDPGDSPDVDLWNAHVLITVAIRTTGGFTEVVRDRRVSRINATDPLVLIHPSPNGQRAILRFSHRGSEVSSDNLEWITLPADSPAPGSTCSVGSATIPGPGNLRVVPSGEENYELSMAISTALSRMADREAATTEDEVARLTQDIHESLIRALWEDPSNDVIRAAVVEAIVARGYDDLAAEVAKQLPDTTFPPLSSLARPQRLVNSTPGDAEGAETGAAALSPQTRAQNDLICEDGGCIYGPALTAAVGTGASPAPGTVGPSCSLMPATRGALGVLLPVLLLGGFGVVVLRRRR